MNDGKPLQVLIIEDSEFDAWMLVNVLRQGGYAPAFQRVETAASLQAALQQQAWDIILADYNLPQFSAPEALKLLQASNLDLPFIVVSGGIGEDTAVALMKAGAHDYVMKGNLTRLVPAVERELREAATRRARREAEAALRESEFRYRLLWETASDAVILMDTDSRIRFVNPAVEQVFGYRPEELIGQQLALLQPESLQGAHLAGMKRYQATRVKSANWRATETNGRRKDGTEFPIEVSFSDMELQGQRYFVGFVRDITERKRAEQELRENQEQFRVAREIQQRLFPKCAPALPGFDIAGATYCAEETGGDYYDYLPMLHGCVGLVVADVTGHGVGPAMLMAETRAYLRILARNREDLGDILTRASRSLAEDVDFERFVTLLLAKVDARNHTLVYCNAGHPSGYLLDAAGKVKLRLGRTGPPPGLQAGLSYQSAPAIPLAPGDLLVLTTDGVEEAISATNEFFGLERTLDCLRVNAQRSAREMVEALYQTVTNFVGQQMQLDDLTALIVKYTGNASGPDSSAGQTGGNPP
jgi:sigma-B regulation protein RsbU (phosphoserine phosphatase)